MGMDWHSSGITTSVIGALKRGLAPLRGELGLHVCGGRGAHSRKTPGELVAIGERVGFDGAALAQASRLVAKVDSAAVQDGFDLYLHGFIVADDGHWVVVQQGMNGDAPAGAPLSLAVGGPEGASSRRRTPRSRAGAGRDRQPDRRARRGARARGQLDLLRRSRPRRRCARDCWRSRRPTTARPAAAAASRHAGASRRRARGRRAAPPARRLSPPPPTADRRISPSCC